MELIDRCRGRIFDLLHRVDTDRKMSIEHLNVIGENKQIEIAYHHSHQIQMHRTPAFFGGTPATTFVDAGCDSVIQLPVHAIEHSASRKETTFPVLNSILYRKFVTPYKSSVKTIVRNKYVLRSLGFVLRSKLSFLAALFGTDKLEHGYTPHYQTLFSSFRNKRFSMLEIGIGGDGEGGYSAADKGGESLRMWKAFFPRAHVHGLDIHDKTGLQERRISIWHGSQIDKSILDNIAAVAKGLQLVIDDGSHRCEHVIQTFEILFPQINPGAFYIIEDTQTSYWPEYGGDVLKHDPTGNTTMGYFKKLADGVNHAEFRLQGYQPTYFDTHIESIAFYHNLIVIKKV